MRTLSDKTEFTLHYIVLRDPLLKSDLPEDLDFFSTDTETGNPLTISFRCNDEYSFNKILALSFKDSEILNPINQYTLDGIYGKTGGIELISEYMLSNFISDTSSSSWIDPTGAPLHFNIDGTVPLYPDGKWTKSNTGFLPPSIIGDEIEFTFNNITYKKMFENNLTLASDFRNLIQQRKYHYDNVDEPMYGKKRFQYNINQEYLKKWIDEYSIPDLVDRLLSDDQKKIIVDRLIKNISYSWIDILKNIFNQKFQIEKKVTQLNRPLDPWGSSMYSSLGGDGEEDVYLSEGISIRPDGTLTDD